MTMTSMSSPSYEAGAAGYLLKDVRGQEVIEAVRAVRAGESVLHPVVARKALDHFVHATDGSKAPGTSPLTDRELEVSSVLPPKD